MKSNIKYIILGVLIVAVVIAGIFIFKNSKKNNNPLKDQKLDGLTVTNVSIKYENGVSTYKATVKATKDINPNYIKMIVKKDGKEYELVGYIGKELKNGEEAVVNASTDKDITNPEKIEYSVVNK